MLEHLVDVVLMFEGDALRSLRVLRAQKNRFGATDEIGLFEMSDRGLVSVTDASRLHDRADLDRPGSCTFVAMEGTRPLTIDVQALVAPSELAMPRRLASGFDRNRLSLLLAVLARHGGLGPRPARRLRQRRRRCQGRRAGSRSRSRAGAGLGGARRRARARLRVRRDRADRSTAPRDPARAQAGGGGAPGARDRDRARGRARRAAARPPRGHVARSLRARARRPGRRARALLWLRE